MTYQSYDSRPFTMHLKESLHRELKSHCTKSGQSMRSLVEKAIRHYLNSDQQDHNPKEASNGNNR